MKLSSNNIFSTRTHIYNLLSQNQDFILARAAAKFINQGTQASLMFGFLGKKKQQALLKYGFVKDFLQTHRGLFSTYRNKRRKEKFIYSLETFRSDLMKAGISEEDMDLIKAYHSNTQKIFISRHGQTHRNKFRMDHKGDPDLNRLCAKVPNELNEKGVSQAKILGRYLKEIIHPSDDVLFVTSELTRTKDTARIAAEAMGREFKTYPTAVLNDMLNQDLLPKSALEQPWAKRMKEKGTLATMDEIKDKCGSEFRRVVNESKDKTIVFVLHDQVNKGIILSLGHDVAEEYFTRGNASLYIFDRLKKDEFRMIQGYVPNRQMRELLA